MSAVFSFALTIFLSAFLLFQIQPLISHYILPWFGGTPAVWSTSLLFFQILLLGGYAYADRISRQTKKQTRFHIILLAFSVMILLASAYIWGTPLLPGASWKPPDASLPILRIFVVLAISVGLPYFVLSTTSPLLQSWFKSLHPNQNPYSLYALSNFGSFLALISYPLIFAPLFTLKEQSRLWSWAYLLYVILCTFLAIKLLRSKKPVAEIPLNDKITSQGLTELSLEYIQEDPASGSDKDLVDGVKPVKITFSRKILWVAFPTCSSILLLSITNQLTQEVAVIPFLWVLPLSLYLLSFTIAFSGESWYRRFSSLLLLGIATPLLCYALDRVASIGIFPEIVIYSLFLFMGSLVCHGELYRLRPDPSQLTSFYLLVALGGAVGGLFVNLVAPLIFQGYWELQLGILLTWLLVLVLFIAYRSSIFHWHWFWLVVPLVVLVIGGTGFFFFRQIKSTLAGVLYMQRNFYGVFRVVLIAAGDPPSNAHSLNHGITAHGFQFTDHELRRTPTTYYGRASGIGLALTHYAQAFPESVRPANLRVGVIGLGTGTLAAYGNLGDYYRFYEINPGIIDLAMGKNGYFTYLQDTQAVYDIVSGDARVSLEHELAHGQPQNFDILAVDAFSSDSIPIHLLTSEAFAVYLRHLKPQGVLAIHISNRYLNLAPLVNSLGDLYGLDNVLIASHRENDGSYAAVWVLLSRNTAFFQLPEIENAKEVATQVNKPIRIWTDDYSNLLQVVRMNLFFNIR